MLLNLCIATFSLEPASLLALRHFTLTCLRIPADLTARVDISPKIQLVLVKKHACRRFSLMILRIDVC